MPHQRVVPTCHLSKNLLSAEYKLINTGRNMTWLEALDECRREGNGSQLLSLETTSEQIWVLQETAYQTSRNRYHLMNYNHLLHVNAHMYMHTCMHTIIAPIMLGPLNSFEQMNIQTVQNGIDCKNCVLLDNHTIVVEDKCLGLFADEFISS